MTGKYAERLAEKLTCRHTERLTERKAVRQTDRLTDKHVRELNRQTYSIHKPACTVDRKTRRTADKQGNRQADRLRYRQAGMQGSLTGRHIS